MFLGLLRKCCLRKLSSVTGYPIGSSVFLCIHLQNGIIMNILTFDIEDWYNCDFISGDFDWDKHEVRLYG